MAECSVVYDYDAEEVRMYFTRKADFQHCVRKLEKSQSESKDYRTEINKEEDSFFLTFPIKYSSSPKSLIKGLPRGISKEKRLEKLKQSSN